MQASEEVGVSAASRSGRQVGPPRPVDLSSLWLEALVADPEPFRRPQAPLGKLIAEAGLDINGTLVAPDGFDWDEWAWLRKIDRVGRRWGP